LNLTRCVALNLVQQTRLVVYYTYSEAKSGLSSKAN